MDEGVAVEHVAGGILLAHLPQGGPGTHVRPAHIQRESRWRGGALGGRLPGDVLHDRVVDGVAGAGGEGPGIEAAERRASSSAVGEGPGRGLGDIRAEALDQGQPQATP